jgi:hypothetical protein
MSVLVKFPKYVCTYCYAPDIFNYLFSAKLKRLLMKLDITNVNEDFP